jgi:microcin C transport system permease protein
MSATLPTGDALPVAAPEIAPGVQPMSPNQRAWARFRRNRIGYVSLWIFAVLLALATFAELVSNDRPFVARINGQWYFPIVANPTEAALGGDFLTPTDWKDPFITALLDKPENWTLGALNPHSANSVDYFDKNAPPWKPTAANWLGTDDKGRDVAARLLYGFRISVLFGLTLTFFSSIIGLAAGAIQGYYGGAVDILGQRFMEVWSGMPTLFMLIILSSVVQPNFWWLLLITLLFGWMSLVGVVRAEFLRARNFEYVLAARALGMSNARIMFRHILPNATVAAVTFMPFILAGSITTLTSLDFLGFGLPVGSPSLGELLAQGKANLQAPWLGISSFVVLASTLLLLVFAGEAVRDALDPRVAG